MKLTFMGTAGARFMVAKQIAASGGLYLEDGDTRISLDPGPGAVVQYAKRKIDLTKLDAIVISHRHLDHSNDVNVMIEAMTEGGFRPRGTPFRPGTWSLFAGRCPPASRPAPAIPAGSGSLAGPGILAGPVIPAAPASPAGPGSPPGRPRRPPRR